MRRYFYTDALSAAWMAKHFGMLSAPETGLEPTDGLSPAENVWLEAAAREAVDEPVNWYIHPDSLHLLEPIEGDVVWLIDEDGVTHVDVIDPQFPLGNQWHFDNGGKIVLRGGEPFFSPEQEGE